MTAKLIFTSLQNYQIDEIVSAFKAIGWNKPREIYATYLTEQSQGGRSVIVAHYDNRFAGYVTIKWVSDYPYFNNISIPEIADLNVLPSYQNRGIGTKLILQAESCASKRGLSRIGIGVGMTADYGNAQKLYVNLSFIPDKNGLHYKCHKISCGDNVIVDDDLVLYFTKDIATNSDRLPPHLPSLIETSRLLIRSPQIGDGKQLNTAVLESFELLNQHMLWANEKPSLEESEEVIKRESANWLLIDKNDLELMLLIFDRNTNDLIGATGFYDIDWDVPFATTGYWIRNKYSGKGLMTEAINAITQYAFRVLKVKRFAITCDIDNERSKRIPERLGYHFESLMKSSRIKPITNAVTDSLVYVRNDLIDLPDLNVSWKYSDD